MSREDEMAQSLEELERRLESLAAALEEIGRRLDECIENANNARKDS